MTKLTNREKQEKFLIQLSLLRSYVEMFDSGNKNMALPMATQIRVLLHETNQSHSLLKQLDLQKKVKFWNSPLGRFNPDNMIPTWDLLVQSFGNTQNKYQPMGSKQRFNKNYDDSKRQIPEMFFPFEIWWNMIVFSNSQLTLTRREVVLFLANKDGGAHIDASVSPISGFKRTDILGWTDKYKNFPEGNPIYLAMRQIVEEFLVSLEIYKTNFQRVIPSFQGKIQFRRAELEKQACYFTFMINENGTPNDTSRVDKKKIIQTSGWKLKLYDNPKWSFLDDSELGKIITILEV